MIYLYGIDFMLDKTTNTEDSIKEHIKDNLESMNDDVLRKDIILANNLKDNRDIFINLNKEVKSYDLFESCFAYDVYCRDMVGSFNVFIMLVREFCKEEI